MVRRIDDDDVKASSNKAEMNNSFTQIQSRRFNPRRELQQRENKRPPSSSLQLPCRWSLCPTMDLVAVGIGNCVDIVISTAADADDNDDGTKIPESTKHILPLDVSVSVSIHRLQSWRTLLTLASVKLVSCPSFASGGDDDDADVRRIHCLEDIERECGVSTFLMALKEDVNSSSSAAAKEEKEDDDITNLEEGKGGDKVSKNDNYNNNNNDQRQYDTTMMHKNTKKDMMMSRNVIINGATCLTWSPDGRRFAIGLLDGGVLIRAVEHLDSRGGKGGGGGALSSSSSSSASTSAAVGLGGGVGDDADDDNDGDASHVIRPPPPSSPPHSHVRGVNRHSSSKNTITATTTMTTNTTTLTNTLLNYSTLQPDEHKQIINDGSIGDENCGSIYDYGHDNGGGNIMNNANNNNADDIGRAVTFDNDGGARDQRRQMEMTKRVTRSMTRHCGVEEEKQQQKGGEKMSADSQLITISKSSLQVITEDDIIQQTMTVEEEDDAKISTTLTILSSTSAPVIGMTWKRFRPSCRRRWRRLRYCTNDDNEEKKFKVGYEQREEDEYKGTVDECEALETWKHASQLLDKGVGYYLPDPHRFANNSGGGGGDDDGVRMMNTSSFRQRLVAEGVLDVLCVATTSEIHWYLRGRYRILSVSHGLSTASLMPLSPSSLNVEEHDSRSRSGGNGCVIDLVCSPDLGTLLAVSNVDAYDTNRQTAKLFSTPLLPRKRFELQYLSYAYTSLFSRLWDVKKGIREALMSWRTTLRPLDTKFNDLSKLLCDYGVDGADNNAESIRLELLKFILRGRVTIKSTSITSTSAAAATSSSSTSALDQFFTRAQMHDTLLQREAKMIESCASCTEGILRSHVLASIRAIVYEAQELYGVAYSRVSSMDNIDSFIDVKTALCLYKASQSLFLTFNQCLQNVIEARSRIHDLLSWLRGTAAQVRAWGTASDSVQRRNAKALRVSDIVVRRVATFLTFEAKACDGSRRILTECIIGMPLSVSNNFTSYLRCSNFTVCLFGIILTRHYTPHFQSKDFFIKLDESNPTVPINNRRSTAVNLTSSIQSMFRICTVLFDKPRRVLAESIGVIGKLRPVILS